jgi:hypothetical protein
MEYNYLGMHTGLLVGGNFCYCVQFTSLLYRAGRNAIQNGMAMQINQDAFCQLTERYELMGNIYTQTDLYLGITKGLATFSKSYTYTTNYSKYYKQVYSCAVAADLI